MVGENKCNESIKQNNWITKQTHRQANNIIEYKSESE